MKYCKYSTDIKLQAVWDERRGQWRSINWFQWDVIDVAAAPQRRFEKRFISRRGRSSLFSWFSQGNVRRTLIFVSLSHWLLLQGLLESSVFLWLLSTETRKKFDACIEYDRFQVFFNQVAGETLTGWFGGCWSSVRLHLAGKLILDQTERLGFPSVRSNVVWVSCRRVASYSHCLYSAFEIFVSFDGWKLIFSAAPFVFWDNKLNSACSSRDWHEKKRSRFPRTWESVETFTDSCQTANSQSLKACWR